MISWTIVIVTLVLPVNWLRIRFFEPQAGAELNSLIVASLLCWSISGALAFFLIKSAQGLKLIEAKRQQALEEFAAQPLSPIRPVQALLKPHEVAYASVAATLKETQTVGYRSGNSGVSVRVMKGVTVHSGGSHGHAVKAMVPVAAGELVITNQRVIFAGDAQSFSLPLSKLINVTNYSDGIAFHEGHKTHLLGCADPFLCRAFAMTVQKVIQLAADGAPKEPTAV
jgi:hypothetical protein